MPLRLLPHLLQGSHGFYHFTATAQQRSGDHFVIHLDYLGTQLLLAETDPFLVASYPNVADTVYKLTGVVPLIYRHCRTQEYYWTQVATKYPLWVAHDATMIRQRVPRILHTSTTCCAGVMTTSSSSIPQPPISTLQRHTDANKFYGMRPIGRRLRAHEHNPVVRCGCFGYARSPRVRGDMPCPICLQPHNVLFCLSVVRPGYLVWYSATQTSAVFWTYCPSH